MQATNAGSTNRSSEPSAYIVARRIAGGRSVKNSCEKCIASWNFRVFVYEDIATVLGKGVITINVFRVWETNK